MSTLAQVQESTEIALCDAITTAWGVSKVHTSPRETEVALSDLPLAYCILMDATPAEEGEGSMCSESGRLQWSILLHAKKPNTGTLASDKRQKAQALRTAVKNGVPLSRWEGEQYDARDDAETEATDGAYLLRVRFSTFVEWTED